MGYLPRAPSSSLLRKDIIFFSNSMNLCDSCLFPTVFRLETVHCGGHGELLGCWKKRRSGADALNSSLRGRRLKQSGYGFVSSLKVSYGVVCRAYEPLRKGVGGTGGGKGFEEPGLGEPCEASEVLNWRSRGVEEVRLKQKLEKDGSETVNGERVHKSAQRGGKRPDVDSTGFEEVGGGARSSDEALSDDYMVREDDLEGSDLKISKIRGPGGKQVMRRSSMLAKQVISIQSALSLGFVSQLWIDTRLWEVLLVEVRPNLLSGEMERFLLEDIYQVGDVVLVPDESVIEKNELNMIGLDTLVGYNVMTQDRRRVGKVRGFTFNLNSGAVETLEIDSYGISIIPASLVSTYGLLAEDVAEVTFDTVVVYSDAVPRLQRLTKGFWDSQNEGFKAHLEEYSDFRNQHRRRGNYGSRKLRRKAKNIEEDWELPMEF